MKNIVHYKQDSVFSNIPSNSQSASKLQQPAPQIFTSSNYNKVQITNPSLTAFKCSTKTEKGQYRENLNKTIKYPIQTASCSERNSVVNSNNIN